MTPTIPNPRTRKLERLILKSQRAYREVHDEMAKVWPVGTMVHVYLRHGQRRPTVATVQALQDFHVVVRLQTLNRRGYNTVKRVYWNRVCAS
jgi:hypothetical protein